MKKGTLAIITGIVMIVAALGITAYNMWDSSRAENASAIVLQQLVPQVKEPVVLTEIETELPKEIEYPDYILNPNMDMPVQNIDGIDYIGILNIPEFELELPVISEWSYPRLKTSPCRYVGSAYLDNMVIAAHNYDSHFGQLKNLSLGSSIIFTDTDGNEFVYEAVEVEILQPTAIEEMITGEWDLTLFTCTIGGQSRVTVRCERCE